MMTVIPDLTMSPFDEVRAQLGSQKWAVDTRDAAALDGIYASDCELVLHNGGPEGSTEVARLRGCDAIIAFMVAGWERTAADWYPGSMVHHVGTPVIEPADGGRISCRSYATYIHLRESGSTEVRGYGKYFDSWALEDGTWRLASRMTHVYGITLGAPRSEDAV